MIKTAANPDGLPREVFDELRAALAADRAQLWRDLASGPFFGGNRPGAKVSQATIDAFWLQGMLGGAKNEYECIEAFSATDFSADLPKIDVPTLLIHGDDDQIVPFANSAPKAAKLIPNATLRVYRGAPHGLPVTHRDQLNQDVLSFVRTVETTTEATAAP
jgi:non-heme chloroperoxidase